MILVQMVPQNIFVAVVYPVHVALVMTIDVVVLEVLIAVEVDPADWTVVMEA